MNKKRFGKIFSFLTAAAMTLTFAAPNPVFAETNARGEISIVSEADFAEFVKSCVLDSNTIGKNTLWNVTLSFPQTSSRYPHSAGLLRETVILFMD